MERISYKDVPQGMFAKLQAIEDYLHTSSIGLPLFELVKLRVSQINGCAYCVDMHHKELKNAGETDLRLASVVVWEETPYFSEKERVALEFAEALTLIREQSVTDELFDRLLNFFNQEELCFLTLAITQINTWNRINRTFQFTPGNYKVGQFA